MCVLGSSVCSLGERKGGGGIPGQPGQVSTLPHVRMQVLLSGSSLATLSARGVKSPSALERGRWKRPLQDLHAGLFPWGQSDWKWAGGGLTGVMGSCLRSQPKFFYLW